MPPFLDADGLFNGDRLRRCSNLAQLHFPRLLLASDAYGRLELNYAKLLRAYVTFKPIPSEVELQAWVQEYYKNYLLFPYIVDGQMWGQWDTKSEFLPRYKTAVDRRSPKPPEVDFAAWKSRYRSEYKAFPKFCGNIPETFRENFVQSSVVLSSVEECRENTCASQPDARGDNALVLKSTEPRERLSSLRIEQGYWFPIFWESYWLKKAKKDAWKAFQRLVKTKERFEAIMTALRAQTPEMLQRDPDKRPYPATWLNGERWQDEIKNKPMMNEVTYGDLSAWKKDL